MHTRGVYIYTNCSSFVYDNDDDDDYFENNMKNIHLSENVKVVVSKKKSSTKAHFQVFWFPLDYCSYKSVYGSCNFLLGKTGLKLDIY